MKFYQDFQFFGLVYFGMIFATWFNYDNKALLITGVVFLLIELEIQLCVKLYRDMKSFRSVR